MTTQPASARQTILDLPMLSRIRRNHGLEHATLHLLARRFPRKPMGGYSDPGGFWIVGSVPTEALQEAIEEALTRMRAGEHNLAIHPNCGTNFITAGTLAGLSGALAMVGVGRRWQDKLERLPLARDIRLVHAWSCPQGRCAAGRGVVEESISEDGLAIERSWRGPGGRVSASIWDGRAEVTDDRRGYTVTLASRELRGPRAR